MSWQRRLLNWWLRSHEKPALSRIGSPQVGRERLERQARHFRVPPFALFQPENLNGVPATWVTCRSTRPEVILYFHGGGYFMGSAATHRAMLARLCVMSGLKACLPDYRCAPEHPYPAALDDAEKVWAALLSKGLTAQDIVLGGDSAGGGLMLALLARLLAKGQRPAAAFAFSPWTDLTLSGQSFTENARSDVLLPAGRVKEARDYYAADSNLRDPGLSPLFADLTNAPPILLCFAETEILRDDSTRLATALKKQGVRVTAEMSGHLPHVWPIFQGYLPEADNTLARTANFIRQQLPSDRQAES